MNKNSHEQLCLSLQELINIDKDAREFGFQWQDVNMILQQIHNEYSEVKSALDNSEDLSRVSEEIGDLLHSTIAMILFLNLDFNQILSNTVLKFKLRMFALQAVTKQNGLQNLKGQPTSYILDLWAKAKNLSKDVNE